MTELPALTRVLAELDIELDERARRQLLGLRDLLLEANQRTNLTAISDPAGVEIKLVADALALLPLIDAERLRDGREAISLVDIGAGAGFPGLPIAIADSRIDVTMVEATRKKVEFIEQAIGQLGLPNARAIHARSEELAHQPEYRERFDIVTARAVASLPALVELCLPFVGIGGLALFPKGRGLTDEIRSAKNALKLIGAELIDVFDPPTAEIGNTAIVNVRKIHPTPKKYPRSPGTPAKHPL